MKNVKDTGLTSEIIKDQAKKLGSDLCGVASIDRFIDMPYETNPVKILPEAKSIIVIAKRFLASSVKSASTIPYTIIRNSLSRKIDEITIELSYFIEDQGFESIPTDSIEPCNYNSELSKSTGLISLKNAGYQSGLGVIGKNTLLITPRYGNMIWLGALITTKNLVQDDLITKNPCRSNCNLCIDNCPVHAIDGSKFINQEKCWNYAFGTENGGEWRIKCYKCRTICPYSNGFTEY